MGHDLIVLGDCNPDLILTGDVAPVFGQVEKAVESALLTLGGSGSIVAAGASRLGLRTVLVAAVGDDALGRFQAERLKARGVDTAALIWTPDEPTGISAILVEGEDRAILTARGAIDSLTCEAVDPRLIAAASHIHVSSYFLLSGAREGLPGLLAEARAAGTSVSLDTNWDPAGAWDDGLGEVLSLTDIFLPNLGEARRLTGAADAAAALDALAETVPSVAIKLGAAGAIAQSAGTRATAAVPAVDVVDTIGAGDSFDAGFLAGWLARWPLERCLRLACACGSLSTERAGGADAQPDLDRAIAVSGLPNSR